MSQPTPENVPQTDAGKVSCPKSNVKVLQTRDFSNQFFLLGDFEKVDCLLFEIQGHKKGVL